MLCKVNIKDTRTMSLLLTLSIFHTSFQCFYCQLWTCNYQLGYLFSNVDLLTFKCVSLKMFWHTFKKYCRIYCKIILKCIGPFLHFMHSRVILVMRITLWVSFQPSLSAHTRSVVHDVPVAVIPTRFWEDFQKPLLPNYDVSKWFIWNAGLV